MKKRKSNYKKYCYVCKYYDETYGCSIDQDKAIDEEHCVEGGMWYLDHETSYEKSSID